MNKICCKITSIIVIFILSYINVALCDGIFIKITDEDNNSQYMGSLSSAQVEDNQALPFSMDCTYSLHFCACHANNPIFNKGIIT